MALVPVQVRPCAVPVTECGSASTAGKSISFAFTYYQYNANGVLLGSVKVRAALELGASGDELASRSVIEILDVNDHVIGTGCATAVGTRFE